MTFFL